MRTEGWVFSAAFLAQLCSLWMHSCDLTVVLVGQSVLGGHMRPTGWGPHFPVSLVLEAAFLDSVKQRFKFLKNWGQIFFFFCV